VQQVAIPELAAHPVVNAAIQHVQYLSTNSIVTARRILNNGESIPGDEDYLAALAKPASVAHSDIVQFSHTVAETVLRNTGSSTGIATDPAQLFWARVKAYYTAYFQGSFINYFSTPVTKPTLQLTVSDDEITQAAGVFLELLFDQLLSPTVWTDGKNPPWAYYPGGGAKPPTYLGVFKPSPQYVALVSGPPGSCGMTQAKMDTLTYLAKTFSTAASGEVSITVKSFGGVEVPLGIFGKLNVGDNKTLTDLIQLLVSESVNRLTVAIAASILEAIEIIPPPQSSGSSALLAAAYRKTTPKGELIQMYSTPFISASRKSS